MIVIEHINFFEIDRDIAEIMHMNPYEPMRITDEHKNSDIMEISNIQKEIIKGRRFVRPCDGVDVIIGNSVQVADFLGIQYEAWEEIEERYNRCYNENRNHIATINAMDAQIKKLQLPWWKKLWQI